MAKKIDKSQDWYWAAARGREAGERFVIANGKQDLWHRVRFEVAGDESCSWDHVQRTNEGSQLEDILELSLVIVPTYGVNFDRFILEAAQIPVFANHLRNSRHNLCNYAQRPYSFEKMRNLAMRINLTLGTDPEDEWWN